MIHVHFCGESIIDSPRFCSSSVETYGRKEVCHWCGVVRVRAHHYLKIAYLSCWFPAALATRETIFLFGEAFYLYYSLASCPSYKQEVAA